jgi:hypothetical protein
MTEINERQFEERQAELMDWIKRVGEMKPEDEDEKIPDPDQQLVKGILVDLGVILKFRKKQRNNWHNPQINIEDRVLMQSGEKKRWTGSKNG